MSDASLAQETPGKPLKGWHVLLWMLGFFGVVFAVNGVFLYNAITSFPGEDVEKSYLQGLNYNQTLEARAAAAELGWRAEIGVQGDRLIVYLEDKTSEALSGRPVMANIRRSATIDGDAVLTLTPGLSGTYDADVSTLEAGRWDVRVDVYDSAVERVVFSAGKTLYIK